MLTFIPILAAIYKYVARFLLGVELALDTTKGGGAYSFLQASFFRMTSWQHVFY